MPMRFMSFEQEAYWFHNAGPIGTVAKKCGSQSRVRVWLDRFLQMYGIKWKVASTFNSSILQPLDVSVHATFKKEIRASGTEPMFDFKGNRTMKLPKQWPLARPLLATRQERMDRAELRIAFAWAIQKEQHYQGRLVLSPCSWCGQPTGGYCNYCISRTAVCSMCGGTDKSKMAACRLCHSTFCAD
jgi:hypothetical protein